MIHYLIKFVFYTAGVIGLLLIAYVVAKNSLNGTPLSLKKKTGKLEIEETLSISPRKTLSIVRALDERFLIASDANSTTLLAKLNNDEDITTSLENGYTQITETNQPGTFQNFLDESNTNTNINTEKNIKPNSIIQSMLKKLNK